MKYVLYNIRNLAGREKFIFAVMLVCVFVSAWIMTFSYGLYQNFHALVIEGEETGKTAHPNIVEGETLTYGEIRTYIEALPDEVLRSSNNIVVSGDTYYKVDYTLIFDDGTENIYNGERYDSYLVYSRFIFRNGDYKMSSYIADMWKSEGLISTGRFLTDEDEMFGNDYVMIRNDEITNPFARKQYANLIIDDNTVSIYGKEYKIIGTHRSIGLVVPFLSVPSETPANYFSIGFEKTMTKKIYRTLIDTADEVIPGKLDFPELELPDKENLYIYRNIMLISVFIAALTIVNFAFLYNFIFSKRKRQLAIMRICGCTAARAVGICLGECCILCVPVFLAGMLTYIPFMKYVLSPLFEYMAASYSLWIYAAIFGIYIAMLIAIMGVLLSGQIRKTLAEGRKEGA